MFKDPVVRIVALTLLLSLGSCISARRDPQEVLDSFRVEEHAEHKPGEATELPAPAINTDDGYDWVRLVSGEWLRGEVLRWEKRTLTFDSDELGELTIDGADVAEIRSPRLFTVLLRGPAQVVGKLHLDGDKYILSSESGDYEFYRHNVYRFVSGKPQEPNYWSGSVGLGGTARKGNTDSIDYTLSLSFLRKTARSRLPFDYYSAYGELDSQRNTDNQRLNTQFDYDLTSKIFVTPLGIELFRDRIQNLDLRAAPFAALGYRLADTSRFTWEVSGGLGYRHTRYDSVMMGTSTSDDSATGIVAMTGNWEVNSTVEVDVLYNAQVGLEDTTDTNQTATLTVDVDLWWDFDLNVRMSWNRIGLPQPEEDGSVPKNNDFQLTVGLNWDF